MKVPFLQHSRDQRSNKVQLPGRRSDESVPGAVKSRRGLSAMPTTTDLNIATYNFRDEEEAARFDEEDFKRIQETVSKHLGRIEDPGHH
jgi:hypothetical protein